MPTATEVARTIREQIRSEQSLTASAGVAPNKFFADAGTIVVANRPYGECDAGAVLSSVLLIALQAATPTDFHIRVPQTSSAVMINGFFSQGEWQNADFVDVPGTAKLYFQRSHGFVYIAVEYTRSPSGIVDLYLSPREGEIYDLHASAKLGERKLRGSTFSDWNWWNNRDWTANISHVDSFEKRAFLSCPIREYQIRYSRFASDVWRVRFELTAMGANNQTQSNAIFPRGTVEVNDRLAAAKL